MICHEGWRYPETVRWAARRGAQVVFHPQFHEAEPGSYRLSRYADPANTFHEKAALCRAAENTCFFATVNYASEGSPTTSAVVRPDGTLLGFQPLRAERDCSSPISTCPRRPGFSPLAAGTTDAETTQCLGPLSQDGYDSRRTFNGSSCAAR